MLVVTQRALHLSSLAGVDVVWRSETSLELSELCQGIWPKGTQKMTPWYAFRVITVFRNPPITGWLPSQRGSSWRFDISLLITWARSWKTIDERVVYGPTTLTWRHINSRDVLRLGISGRDLGSVVISSNPRLILKTSNVRLDRPDTCKSFNVFDHSNYYKKHY